MIIKIPLHIPMVRDSVRSALWSTCTVPGTEWYYVHVDYYCLLKASGIKGSLKLSSSTKGKVH